MPRDVLLRLGVRSLGIGLPRSSRFPYVRDSFAAVRPPLDNPAKIDPMAKHKPTTERRQIFTFLGLGAAAVLFFTYALSPYLERSTHALVGKPAPVFTLRVIFGGEPGSRINLEDLRGGVVLLDFWASWCPPCRAQTPILDKIAKQAGSGVTVLGVNTGDDEAAAVRFMRSQNVEYASVIDATGAVGRAFGATELPTLVVVDPAGAVFAVERRLVPESEILELIRRAKSEPSLAPASTNE